MAPRKRRIATQTAPSPPSAQSQSTPSRARAASSAHLNSPLDPISPWPPILPDEPGLADRTTTTQDSAIADDGVVVTHPSTSSTTNDLPSAKEIYGSIAVLLTGLGYIVYLAWAFLPSRYLDAIGWTWYPARDWALVIPCWLMVVVLLAYLVYAGMSVYLTPSWEALELITDEHSHIPGMDDDGRRYYWDMSREGIMPPALDLPLDVVNRTLYPPRRPNTQQAG